MRALFCISGLLEQLAGLEQVVLAEALCVAHNLGVSGVVFILVCLHQVLRVGHLFNAQQTDHRISKQIELAVLLVLLLCLQLQSHLDACSHSRPLVFRWQDSLRFNVILHTELKILLGDVQKNLQSILIYLLLHTGLRFLRLLVPFALAFLGLRIEEFVDRQLAHLLVSFSVIQELLQRPLLPYRFDLLVQLFCNLRNVEAGGLAISGPI